MIAEIHHKVGCFATNQDRLEDELTGNFFGTLRYLPFSRGIQKILEYAYSDDEKFHQLLNSINTDDFEIEFWKRSEDNREIDAVLEVEDLVIGIEVKYNSGLSGSDQLIIEERMLNSWYREKKRLLLFVAREEDVKKVYDTHKDILTNVHFGYLTWQNALRGLDKIITTSVFEKKMVNDLKQLLSMKRFVSFIGFSDVCDGLEISGDSYYTFENEYSGIFFDDIQNMDIDGGMGYEFK